MRYPLDSNICIYAMKNRPQQVLPSSPPRRLRGNLIVVTNNVDEFERVPDLRIENWAA